MEDAGRATIERHAAGRPSSWPPARTRGRRPAGSTGAAAAAHLPDATDDARPPPPPTTTMPNPFRPKCRWSLVVEGDRARAREELSVMYCRALAPADIEQLDRCYFDA